MAFDNQKNPIKVGLGTLKKWPTRLVRKLHDWVKHVSNLDEADTEEQVVAQIKRLQKRLKDLRENKADGSELEDPSAPLPDATLDTSPSAES